MKRCKNRNIIEINNMSMNINNFSFLILNGLSNNSLNMKSCRNEKVKVKQKNKGY